MRLYIPTSSLNADNILSCESITPAYECRKRKFGYSTFNLLLELERFNRVTLAFTKIPKFHTFDPDRESFAMVVAVDIEDPKSSDIIHIKSINGVDVYATSTPIHLTPSTTNFIFFDNRAKDYTLHSSADSAKCKLFDFYKSSFIIADSRSYGENLRTYVDKIDVPEISPLFSENKFDKAKGFIWGYGIGNMLSLPRDIAYLHKIQKRIYDIISSTRNESYIPASLTDELARLDDEFSSIDPNQKAIKTAWVKYIKDVADKCFRKDFEASIIDEFLKELGAESFVKNKFLTSNQFTLRKKLPEYSKLGQQGLESYNRDIADYTECLINKTRIKSASEPFSESLDVDTASYDTVMMSADDRVSKLFNKILFRVIWNNLIPSLEELRVNKAEVAKNVVIAIKSIIEELGEKWAGAPIQLYFNSMRKNISEFTEFNINEIDDIVLQSVAAFLLKGEDFDSLKQYLVANAFSNYRYAFALWGAVSGYVAISRSVIESEFTKENTALIFSEAQSALNLDSAISVPQTKAPEKIVGSSSPESGFIPNTIPFKNKVIAYFEKIRKGKRCQNQMKEELLAALEQLGDNDNSFLFICTLNDYPKWSSTSKAWQEMQAEFCPDYSEQIRKKTFTPSSHPAKAPTSKSFWNKVGDLFQHREDVVEISNAEERASTFKEISPNDGLTHYKLSSHRENPLFINDRECRQKIEQLIPHDILIDFIVDFDWFRTQYALGDKSPYYAKASRKNQSTIEAFIRYISKKRYASKIDLDNLSSVLHKLYV